MVEAEETDEGLQSIRLCPLGVHCLRESQEQKTLVLSVVLIWHRWICRADTLQWSHWGNHSCHDTWKLKLIFKYLFFPPLLDILSALFKCFWLHGSQSQTALQGAGSVHLRASLLLLLQLLSWEEASVDRKNGDQWRRTNRREVAEGHQRRREKQRNSGRQRDREYLSPQELRCTNSWGILIIMRGEKNPKRERTRWVEGFGGFRNFEKRIQGERAVGCWTLFTTAVLSATCEKAESVHTDIQRKCACVALSRFNSYS